MAKDELKAGDWVILRTMPPKSGLWLRVVSVAATEIEVTDRRTTFTVSKREVLCQADAATLENP